MPARRPVGAGRRAALRWSAWRLLALPLGFLCAVAVFLSVSRLVLRAQIAESAPGVFYCAPTHVAAVVLLLALAVWSIPVGFLVANLLLAIVPVIRQALSVAEAKAGQSVATQNMGLLKFAGVATIILGPLCLAASAPKTCLSNTELFARPGVFSQTQVFGRGQMTELRPGCVPGSRSGWNFSFAVITQDGHAHDLATVGPWFRSHAGQIQAALHGIPLHDEGIDPGCPAGLRQLISVQ